MSLLRHITSGLQSLFRKKQSDRDLDNELASFAEMAVVDKIKQGVSRTEAYRQVRLEHGTTEIAREQIRSAGWESILESTWRDIHVGIRSLRKSPGFAVVAIITLALGIGANTVIFSAVYAVLLKPLPFKNADRLVFVRKKNPPRGWIRNPISPAEIIAWRSESGAF